MNDKKKLLKSENKSENEFCTEKMATLIMQFFNFFQRSKIHLFLSHRNTKFLEMTMIAPYCCFQLQHESLK